MPTGLRHIEDFQIDEAAFLQYCNHFSVGPLKIDYCVDLTVPRVTFSVFLAGVRIGGGTIDRSEPCVKVGGGAGGFKAEVELCLDLDRKRVVYQIELCAPIVGCRDHKGVLFSW